MSLPESVTEDDDALAAGAIFIWRNGSSDGRLSAQGFEQVRVDESSLNLQGFRLPCEILRLHYCTAKSFK